MSIIPAKIPVVVGAIPPKPNPEAVLAAALSRFLATGAAPAYLRAAGTSWLAARNAK